MCATAAGFSASAASPYTVSVGSPITAPARKAATALASSVVWADVGMAVRDRTAGLSKCPSILQRNQQQQQQVDQNSGTRRRQDRYDDVDHAQAIDRKSGVSDNSASVRVDLGGRRILIKQ